MFIEHIRVSDFYKKDELVECGTCACLILKENAQKVDEGFLDTPLERFYCKIHEKPYKSCIWMGGVRKYTKLVEVDELGVPVGYVKKK